MDDYIIFVKPHTNTINLTFVDDDNKDKDGKPQPIKDAPVESVKKPTGSTVAFLPPSLEERGYLLSKGFTINYNSDNGKPTFETDQNGNAIIHLHHKKITSSKPKTITRTINITEPGQETKTTVQAAQIYRDVTVYKVTNGVTYGDWSTDANDWAEVDVPSYIGYTHSQTKVDAVTVKDGQKNVTVNITYTANTQTGSIVYVDVDNNVEVGHTDLTGKTDQSVTITPAAPAGYDIVAGQNIPNSEVATATGIPTVTVKVSHHKITVTPGQEPKPGDKIPGNPDKKPGDGTPTSDVSYETLHRNMTRTINVKDPHTGLKATKVTIHYERTATIGDVTYDKWTVSDGSDTGFAKFDIPEVAGYTSEIKAGTADDLAALTPSQDQITNWADQTVDIDYTANDQSMTIDYVDKNGNLVTGGQFVVSGKTDQTVDTNAKIPTGWVLVPGQTDAPATITFGGTPTADITVKIQHGTTNVPHTNPVKSGDKTPTGEEIKGAHESDLNQTITRTINITEPGKSTQTTTQTAKIYRDATYDNVTGEVTYGTWSTDAKDWTAVEIPVHAGYTVHQSDNKSGVPTVTVKVQHHKIVKTPNDQDLKNLGDMIPANPSKKPGDGTPNTAITHSGLVRDMTRTITINAPANHVGTTTNNMTL